MSASANKGPLAALLAGEAPVVTVEPDGSMRIGAGRGMVVLSGAFNPLHVGHERMLEAARKITGRPPAFELSVVNVEKPEMTAIEVESRLCQFAGLCRALVTRAPTFVGKSRLLPGTLFVIGYDTAVRLFDDRYYPPYDPGNDPERTGSATLASMAEIRRNDCGFLVAGRLVDGKFRGLRDIDVPAGYEELLAEIPPDRFREDISSTEIRGRLRGGT